MAYTVLDDTLTRTGGYPSNPTAVAPNSTNGVYSLLSGTAGDWSITGAGAMLPPPGNIPNLSVLARPQDEASDRQRVTLTYAYGSWIGPAARVQADGGGYFVLLVSGVLQILRRASGTGAINGVASTTITGVSAGTILVVTMTVEPSGSTAVVTVTVTGSGVSGGPLTYTDTNPLPAGSAGVCSQLRSTSNTISSLKYEELVTLTDMEIITGTAAGTSSTNTFTLNRTAGTGRLPIRAACLESTTVPGQWLPGNTAGQSSSDWTQTIKPAGATQIVHTTSVPSSGNKYVKLRVYDATGRNIICPQPSGGSGTAPPTTFGKVTSNTAELWTYQFFTVKPWQGLFNVVRVGDSITSMSQPAEYDSNGFFGLRIRDLIGTPPANVSVVNIGSSGSTSQNWQKTGGSGLYSNILPAFASGATNVVSIMLGLNDVRAGTQSGLAGRINSLCADILADATTAGHVGTIIVVHSLTPRPYFNGASDYQRWFDAVADLRDNVTYTTTVRRGSTLHADELSQRFLLIDEVHLSADGDELLADYQARAIAAVITGGWDGSGLGVGLGLL